ncbi:MAG: hypothetical protein M0009_08870 [Deltaproteobacteria bacterium]|nr:hypothetical protein [Deltaproteobacteria bacterium]
MSDIWFETDERQDALASLMLYAETITRCGENVSRWKWALISLHSAVQAIMAIHLGFGNNLLVMRQEDAEAWLKAHDDEEPYPNNIKMDGFLNLYKKIKRHTVFGYKFVPKGQQSKSVKRLNEFRNEFVHFMPKGWSIQLSGLPQICLDCLDVINELHSGFVRSRWESEEQATEFEKLLSNAIMATKNIHDNYSANKSMSRRPGARS